MTEAGRNDRSIQEFATVDWMAYQGAPDGGVAGKSRISKWWTGSQCKEVNLPQAFISFLSSFFSRKGGEGSFWDGDGVRGHATLPLICMIKNLKEFVVSLEISMRGTAITLSLQLPSYVTLGFNQNKIIAQIFYVKNLPKRLNVMP